MSMARPWARAPSSPISVYNFNFYSVYKLFTQFLEIVVVIYPRLDVLESSLAKLFDKIGWLLLLRLVFLYGRANPVWQC